MRDLNGTDPTQETTSLAAAASRFSIRGRAVRSALLLTKRASSGCGAGAAGDDGDFVQCPARGSCARLPIGALSWPL